MQRDGKDNRKSRIRLAPYKDGAFPFGAHQVSRHMADREDVHLVAVFDNAGRVAAFN